MSLKKSRKSHQEDDTDAWLITFADMTVLLMSFFVLLFALSSPDSTRFREVSDALRKHGFYNDALPIEDPYEKLKKELSASMKSSGYDQFMAVTDQSRVVSIDLAATSFFAPGSAKFTPDALPMLKLMSVQLEGVAKEKVMVSVEGHTDDTPSATELYPSNWELSTARAANVVRYLIANGFPANKVRAVGFADTQPKAANRDARGNPIPANQEINRRVIVRIMRDGRGG